MKNLLLASALALSLGGCTTIFGQDQKAAEAEYVTGALLADAGILSGKETPNVVGDICMVDGINYAGIASTRSSKDTFSYVPADSAHAKLQADGAPIAPAQCK